MKVTIGQINSIIGDVEGNVKKIKAAISKAISDCSELIIFPELSLLGFPPFDLLKRKNLKKKIEDAISDLINEKYPIGVLIGVPTFNSSVFNSAILIHEGKVIGRQDKFFLGDDPLLQNRYFSCGKPEVITFNGKKLGIVISDDLLEADFDLFSDFFSSVDLIINISSSFYYYGKRAKKIESLKNLAKSYGKKVIYVNQIGGNGELIFDGGSLVFSEGGELIFESKIFEEDIVTLDLDNFFRREASEEDISFIYKGLVLGVRDYFKKSGFKKAFIGLSGGIDSALVACIAKDALSSDNVVGIGMPSIYTAKESIEDAKTLSQNLGIEFRIIPIKDIFYSYLKELNPSKAPIMDLAEENLQSRIRGNLLMFLSNREGGIVLATGNRSEALTGYCTLYGDTAGALEVIGDIYKTMVYDVAKYVNREEEIIPHNILVKIPSAELRPGQKDEDSLPPYGVLDPILNAYVDQNKTFEEILEMGFNENIVKEVIRKVESSEYKRRQIPPVLRIRSKNPLRERNLPLVHKFI